MADRVEQVSANGLVDAKQEPGAPKRRQYSEASKRQMVAETQLPGASVSTVARRHHVNSNQLFPMAAAARVFARCRVARIARRIVDGRSGCAGTGAPLFETYRLVL